MTPADGVGRRKADVKELNLDGLRIAKTTAEQRIVERMLRTAAATNVATGGRGVYSSKAIRTNRNSISTEETPGCG